METSEYYLLRAQSIPSHQRVPAEKLISGFAAVLRIVELPLVGKAFANTRLFGSERQILKIRNWGRHRRKGSGGETNILAHNQISPNK
ncbi:hypothetical protein chiPu_0011326 [Chiloscyllium punctatum]|uniref:Uncharacterized protein n=1 Tax=Chiloscyllium punctatum TaxID=137246 RepID=A0A401SR68_CHIPU|nr:hypothetical protein [Chiloscyllium punctatum]